jgi:hypothetical protein
MVYYCPQRCKDSDGYYNDFLQHGDWGGYDNVWWEWGPGGRLCSRPEEWANSTLRSLRKTRKLKNAAGV